MVKPNIPLDLVGGEGDGLPPCEVSANCLECPLPACRYDDPKGLQRYRQQLEDRRVLEAKAAHGLTRAETAVRFGVSVRHVYRIQGRQGEQW